MLMDHTAQYVRFGLMLNSRIEYYSQKYENNYISQIMFSIIPHLSVPYDPSGAL